MKVRVLYLDDEETNLKVFKASFRRDFDVLIANNANEAREILEKEKDIHVIITDQRMPEETGIEFLGSIIEKHPEPIRILLTGYSDINAVIDAINKGKVFQYLSKPWKDEEIKLIIEKAYEVYDLRQQQSTYEGKLEQTNQQLEFMLRQKLLS